MPHFVVVEDDHLQREPLEDRLSLTFENTTITTLCSEGEFRAALPGLRKNIPDLVVMDVMVRWDYPRRNFPDPPEDIQADGYTRAGLRGAWLLHDDALLRSVPVVLYTILEHSDLERNGPALPANASYVGKTSDAEVLLRHIRSRLRERR
ncbi:hypothetical protein ACU61A_21770 [Pseudonocardia sichuanensis]